jgi:hypothetical protein
MRSYKIRKMRSSPSFLQTVARWTTNAQDHTQTHSVGSPATRTSHRVSLRSHFVLVRRPRRPSGGSTVSRTGRGAHPVLRRPVVNPLIVEASDRRSDVRPLPRPTPPGSRPAALLRMQARAPHPRCCYTAPSNPSCSSNGVVSIRGSMTNVRDARFA